MVWLIIDDGSSGTVDATSGYLVLVDATTVAVSLGRGGYPGISFAEVNLESEF